MSSANPTGIRNPKRTAFSISLAGLALLALGSPVRAQSYALTDLGTLGGTNCLAYAINNHEQITGTSQTAMGDYHAFTFQSGNMMDLGTLGGSNSWGYSVNDNGWTVGASEMPMGSVHGFISTNLLFGPGMMTDLGTGDGTNSVAWMINVHNQMVGWLTTTDGSEHAFVITNMMTGSMLDLGTAGGLNAAALCINSNGLVVGYSTMTNGSFYPIMSTNSPIGASGMMMMGGQPDGGSATGGGMGPGMGAGMGRGNLPGGQSLFVNDLGMVVGMTNLPAGNHHAVASANGGMMGGLNVDLGTLGGSNSVAYCISNSGITVGTADGADGTPHAFVMTNVFPGMARMMDLNDLVATNSGWVMMEARGINAAGQIVGWGMHDGHTNAFLLTPTVGPTRMTSAPASQVTGPGSTVILSMGMSSPEPLSYQWMHDGTVMPSQTNATLTIPRMSLEDSGHYTVAARNAYGTVANASAAIAMFSMNLDQGTVRLHLGAPSGTKFRIEKSDRLGAGASWQWMADMTMAETTNQMSDTLSQESHARFYRATMLP